MKGGLCPNVHSAKQARIPCVNCLFEHIRLQARQIGHMKGAGATHALILGVNYVQPSRLL